MTTAAELTIDTTTRGEAMEHSLVNAEKVSSDFVTLAKAFVVDSQEMAEIAGEDLKEIARRLKAMEEERLSFTRPLDDVKKRLMDKYRPHTERLQEADRILRGALLSWQKAEREKAAAEQRQRDEAARKEREKLEAQLAKAATPAKQEAIMARIDEAAVSHTAVAVAPVKVSGVATRTRWKVRSIDLPALVKAAAANPKLLQYLAPVEAELNKLGVALGPNAEVPGVVFEEVDSLAVSRR